MAIIHANFNPVIPLEERIDITKKSVEISDELVLSIGELEKGFSLSLSSNYSNLGRINETRTETFGHIGLLEEEYPLEIIFPFKISKVVRFFDFSRLLQRYFDVNSNYQKKKDESKILFKNGQDIILSKKEKKAYYAFIKYPEETMQKLSEILDISRHTLSKMKKRFLSENLLKPVTIPNLKKLGFNLLVFYHFKFNPKKPPTDSDFSNLDTPSTIFFIHRKFEAVSISCFYNYQDYEDNRLNIFKYLKEKELVTREPEVRRYTFERFVIIKNFVFSPIIKKILEI
ncbi:MAG: hypothetical protein ACFFCS_11130 [Candidatus Hodarchaeota archaeon]